MFTLTLEDRIFEVAFIKASVSPFVAAPTILLSLVILPLKLNLTKFPCLLAVSMLMVVHPVSFISGAFRVDESTATIGHAIAPLTLINASVCLDHAAQPLHLIVLELSLILGSIGPDEDAEAVLNFAFVDESPIFTI